MSPRFSLTFSDSNREALIIRWQVVLILGLIDYFSSENQFSKIIVCELLDLSEGVIKALAEALQIQLVFKDKKDIQRPKRFKCLFSEIQNHKNFPKTRKQKIQQINDSLSGDKPNSVRNTFRNADAHTLNLATISDETVKRCFRSFDELVNICDSGTHQYAINRPELKDFSCLHKFFYDYIVEQKKFDWSKIKIKKEVVRGKEVTQTGKRKIREVEIERERSVREIIDYIKSGDWDSG